MCASRVKGLHGGMAGRPKQLSFSERRMQERVHPMHRAYPPWHPDAPAAALEAVGNHYGGRGGANVAVHRGRHRLAQAGAGCRSLSVTKGVVKK